MEVWPIELIKMRQKWKFEQWKLFVWLYYSVKSCVCEYIKGMVCRNVAMRTFLSVDNVFLLWYNTLAQ